jgi:hypothetical protein
MREGLDPEGGNKKCQRRTEEEGDEVEPPNQGAEEVDILINTHSNIWKAKYIYFWWTPCSNICWAPAYQDRLAETRRVSVLTQPAESPCQIANKLLGCDLRPPVFQSSIVSSLETRAPWWLVVSLVDWSIPFHIQTSRASSLDYCLIQFLVE